MKAQVQNVQYYLDEERSNSSKTLNEISIDELEEICNSIVKAKKL